VSTYEISKFVEQLVPGDAIGATAFRALLTEGITRWEARSPEDVGGRHHTFLPTSDAELNRIHSAHALEEFRQAYGIRNDWHEPDEQGITAYVLGDHLDNAMGATVEHGHGELQVVIAKEVESEEGTSFDKATFRPIAAVNLATLLSWATSGAYTAKALSEAQAQR
jgi:hypothetical protein